MTNKEYKIAVSKKEHLSLNKTLFKTRSLPIIIIYDLILLIFSIGLFFFEQIFMSIFILCTLVLYTVSVVLLNKYNVKKIFEKSEVLNGVIIFNYVFNETYFTVNVEVNANANIYNVEYNSLYKVIEDRECIYMFINQVSAYIIIKNNIEKEDLNELRELIKKQVKKYKIIK